VADGCGYDAKTEEIISEGSEVSCGATLTAEKALRVLELGEAPEDEDGQEATLRLIASRPSAYVVQRWRTR
jgi:hypothetical protein